MLLKLSNLNSNLALNLGYLNLALNNSAQKKNSHNAAVCLLEPLTAELLKLTCCL